MDSINIGIFENQNKINKIIKYSFDILLSNIEKKYNIIIKPISQQDVINSVFDYLVVGIDYDDYLKFNCESNCELNCEFDKITNGFNKYKKLIIIVSNEEFQKENNILNNDVIFFVMNVNKAIEYLTMVREDIKEIKVIEVIDKILRDELGKQKYKSLDTFEKKISSMKKLIKNKNIVDEWMENVGFNNLVHMVEKNIIDNYNNIIFNHCVNQ